MADPLTSPHLSQQLAVVSMELSREVADSYMSEPSPEQDQNDFEMEVPLSPESEDEPGEHFTDPGDDFCMNASFL